MRFVVRIHQNGWSYRELEAVNAVSPGRVIVGLGRAVPAPTRRHSGCRDTARAEALPILIGGHGPCLLRTAARHADLCNIGFDLTPGEWRRLGPMLAAHAREAGRMPGSPVLTHNATVLLGRALEAAGVTWVFLLFDNPRDLGGLRLFAEAVMPEL